MVQKHEVGELQKVERSPSAEAVLAIAHVEAVGFRHNYIGTEHLVLAIVQQPQFSHAFAERNVTPNKIRTSIEYIIGRGETETSENIGLTPRARKTIDLGRERSLQDGRIAFHAGDMLYGLVSEGEGVGMGVFDSIGVSNHDLREILDSVKFEGHRYSITDLIAMVSKLDTDSSFPDAEKQRIYGVIVSFLEHKQERGERDIYPDF